MALFREFYRLKNLDEERQQKLQQTLYQFIPSSLHNQALSELDSNGKISDDTLKKSIAAGVFREASLPGVRQALEKITSGLPTAKTFAQEAISKYKNESESNLTDDELNQRMDAYKVLGEYKAPAVGSETVDSSGKVISQSPFSQGQVNGQVARLLKENNVYAFSKYDLAGKIGGFLTENKRLPTSEELRDRLGLDPADRQSYNDFAPLKNFLNDARVLQSFDIGNYTDDMKRIQGIIESRASTGRKEGIVNTYLQNAPGEAAGVRQNLYLQQRNAAKNYLQNRIAPKVMEDLNRRGLAENEGDISSTLAVEGANLQSKVEDQIRALEAEDNAFFADSAYRIKQAKLESSEDALREKIALERESARQRQEISFQSKERDLNADFEKRLLERSGKKSLTGLGETLSIGEDAANSSSASALASDLGKSVAETAATKAMTKDTPSAAPAIPERIA